MCLAIPAKIIEVEGERGIVEVNGVRRDCILSFLPGVGVGDYVLIHAGFAIQQWDEDDVQEHRAIMEEIGSVDDA